MLNLQQRLSQQQKLSPQQIQYIKLLQLPTLALEQRIKAELEVNPLLEEGEEEDPEEDTAEESSDATDVADASEETPPEPESREEEYDWDEYINSPEDLYGHKAAVDQGSEEDRREMPMPARVGLAESLMQQLIFLDLDDVERIVAEQIIGSIDEDGYLRRTLESIQDDLAFNHGMMVEIDAIEEVLRRVQRLDPVGVAARDLKECLLVQLDVLPKRTPGRTVALEMLRKTYKSFTMKHYDQIMTKLDVTVEELKEAYELIQRLDPKPGEGEFSAQQNYITPDFVVEVQDNDFVITLNGGNAPELRISTTYRKMLETVSVDQKRGTAGAHYDTETRNFLRSKLETAKWFINSIHQRRQTLLKVMHALVELQADFFRLGEGNLKPMILKDVAEKISMDISTVSRVVNGKYVQTEFGVYELKYFFSEGLATESGEEVSNKEIRAIIEQLISKEDKRKPLSDQALAEALEKRGFHVARRTVTKYREQLNIPVARMRKELIL